MARFLHCADLHLDTKFQYLDEEKNAARREELRAVFSRIVSLAIAERIDVVFIAGDLFEGINATADSLELICSEMERAKPIRFFISPGNHDPFTPASQYALMPFPENAHVFRTTTVERIVLPELNLTVYGAGFISTTCAGGLLTGFQKDPSDQASVCVIHGDLNQATPYHYISNQDIEQSGFDYLALGHIHAFALYQRGKTVYAYPGVPEGRGFDERGDKGVILGEIANGKVTTQFRSTANRKYFAEAIDVTGCVSSEDVVARIMACSFEEPQRNFFKLTCKGVADFALDLDEIMESIAQSFYFVKLSDETTADISGMPLHEDSLKGIFLNNIEAALKAAPDEKQKHLLTMAKHYGSSALERREIKL
ncbi:MAG: DNA repair exonuclease [Clostridia bacterium]